MELYDVIIEEKAMYSTVIEANSKKEACAIAEAKFLSSARVANMFCTTVFYREVSSTLRKKKKNTS